MEKNQKNFLDEFYSLLQKYNISDLYISYRGNDRTGDRITLLSNGQKLEFSGYCNNYFINVGTYEGDYKVGDTNG